MSTDKRKNTAKESTRNNKSGVKDLPPKSADKQDAERVKGGSVKMSDILISSRSDKSSS